MNLIKKIQDWFKRRKFNKNKDSFRFVVVYPEDVNGFKNKMVFDSCVVCGHPKFKLTTLNEDLKGLVCSNCNNTIGFYSFGLQRGSEGHSEIKLLGANRYRKTVVKTPIPTENKHTSNGVRDDTWLKRKLSEPVNHEVDLLGVWCSTQAKDDHVDMTVLTVTPSGGKVKIEHVKRRPVGRGCGLSFIVLDDYISRKNDHHENLEWVPHSKNTKYTEDISEDNNVKR